MERRLECKECKAWEEEMYWKHFNAFHFLQILPPDFHDHLALPEKFASHMKAQLPDKVSFKSPSGASWEIELQKSNDLLFVGNGWKAFVKAHNLNENCILMFKCEKNSSFEVLIFDKGNLCEREAAYYINQCTHASLGHEDRTMFEREISKTEIIEEEEEEDSVLFISENLVADDGPEACSGGHMSDQISRKRTLSPSARVGDQPKEWLTLFKGRSVIRPNYKESSPEENHSDQSHGKIVISKKQVIRKSSNDEMAIKNASTKRRVSKEYMSRTRYMTEEEKENALQRAIQEETETSFTVVLPPTAVYFGFSFYIPAGWLHKHSLLRKEKVVLRVGETTWLVGLYSNDGRYARLSSGWKAFAVDNKLEEFDVLVLKPIQEATVVMDVCIFRCRP